MEASVKVEPNSKQRALKEFWRMMRWIAVAAVLLVGAALWYLGTTGDLQLHMVIATVLGVFVSTILGCGLFALGFFSNKGGYDDVVDQATRSQDNLHHP
jgi:uncharacterized membrane protein YedE/YeeE